MIVAYYHYCDSNEISTSTILGELAKKAWSGDQMLSRISTDFKTENKVASFKFLQTDLQETTNIEQFATR